ncbi:thioesterase family protein [Spirillospora sp. CA-128828]|uniref:thioesterase family protein n=1 Tax=Spirillospora sp. CA-128828 TaxID=3240033 RepID=UPI003D94A2E3
MRDFVTATAVEPLKATGGLERFTAELHAQWGVDTKLHGGYLLAILGRAVGRVAGDEHPHLSASSAAFLRAPVPGPAEVCVETLRVGRTTAQYRARLIQDDQPMVEALVTQERLEDADPWWTSMSPVELPEPQDCFLAPTDPPGAGFPVPLMDVVEEHVDPGVLGFAFGRPSRRGLVAGWQRLADGSDWDPLSLLVALDMLPAATFDLELPGWAPTIQFTAYIRCLPAPGPVRVRMQATQVTTDRIDELVHIWDSKDRLVAHATQLAAIPRTAPKKTTA